MFHPGVHLPVILHDPTSRTQLLVDLLTCDGFRRKVHSFGCDRDAGPNDAGGQGDPAIRPSVVVRGVPPVQLRTDTVGRRRLAHSERHRILGICSGHVHYRETREPVDENIVARQAGRRHFVEKNSISTVVIERHGLLRA